MVSSNSPKKQTNEFVFTTTTNLFVLFLGEFEDTKKSFQNYLTFRKSNHAYLFYTARKDWFDKYYYVAVMLPHVSFNLLAIAVNALLVLSVVKCSRCMMLPWLVANMIW